MHDRDKWDLNWHTLTWLLLTTKYPASFGSNSLDPDKHTGAPAQVPREREMGGHNYPLEVGPQFETGSTRWNTSSTKHISSPQVLLPQHVLLILHTPNSSKVRVSWLLLGIKGQSLCLCMFLARATLQARTNTLWWFECKCLPQPQGVFD